MPRLKAVLQSEFPYNISARCINREWFNIPMDEVWKIFCEELSNTVKKHNLVVHSFVLMSNHFHLIASTPDANISQCMHYFLSRVSRRLNQRGNRINETFAGRHFKCVLQNTSYYLNAYKYNYRNPVSAKLCESVEGYKYSTLQSILKISPAEVTLAEDTTYISDPTGTLKWLNTPSNPEKLEALRKAFKHQYFRSRKNKKTGNPVIGENEVV